MKKNTLILICVAAGIVAAISGVMFFVFSFGDIRAKKEVLSICEGFMGALEEGDIEGASTYCDEEFAGNFSSSEALVRAVMGDYISKLSDDGYLNFNNISEEIDTVVRTAVSASVVEDEISPTDISVSGNDARVRVKVTGVTKDSVIEAAQTVEEGLSDQVEEFVYEKLEEVLTGVVTGKSQDEIYQEAVEEYVKKFVPVLCEAIKNAASGESTWTIYLKKTDGTWKITDVGGMTFLD